MNAAAIADYLTNVVCSNSVFFRNICLGRIWVGPHKFTQIRNLSAAQFSVKTSFTKCLATLLNHVPHVFIMCSEPKMVRVYTSAIVARVKNLHPIWDVAFMKDIGKSVGVMVFVFVSATLGKFSVAVFLDGGSPFPASVRRNYIMSLKTLTRWNDRTSFLFRTFFWGHGELDMITLDYWQGGFL